MELTLCLILAGIWGVIWAAVLEWTAGGYWLAAKRTWLAVVIGVGMDLLLLLVLMPMEIWIATCALIGASAVGIVIRSIAHEWREHHEIMEACRGDQDQVGE